MDFKYQALKDDRNAVDDWDQRKSNGQFRGSEEGLNVKTLFEFRADGDAADALINPDRLSEFIKPGDNAVMVANRIQAHFGLAKLTAGIGIALPWNDLGVRVYDND